MREDVNKLWPELDLIKDEELREKTAKCWEYALDNSVLSADDLEIIPFSLLIDDYDVKFMQHKRAAVRLSIAMAEEMQKSFSNVVNINMDYLISGAILIDVGKLLEYEKDAEGNLSTSKNGKLVRHPISGVAIAERFGLPWEVQHIIATHSKEGDIGKRTLESIIVHHADFVSFEPFQNSKRLEI
jgi:putative nucleotidyltransferase with HDIG domain